MDTQDVPERAATGLEIEFAVGIINYAAVAPEIGLRRLGEGEMMSLEVILGIVVTGKSIFDTTCMIECAHLDGAPRRTLVQQPRAAGMFKTAITVINTFSTSTFINIILRFERYVIFGAQLFFVHYKNKQMRLFFPKLI